MNLVVVATTTEAIDLEPQSTIQRNFNMFKHFSRWMLGFVAICALVFSAQAQMAQTPLLTQSGAVEPNLVLVFDDSGSMDWTYMYQYSVSTEDDNDKYAAKSPDVNLMYYDPRIRYKLQVNADGTDKAPGSISNDSTFSVYFYKPTSSKKVSSVSVTRGGSRYPPSGVTVTFSGPSAGGVRATGTVTVNSNNAISTITVTNAGSGYTSAPTLTLGNKGKGKNFKYTVNLVDDSASSGVTRKWDGTGSVTSSSNFFTSGNPAGYTPDGGSPIAPGATVIAYPNTASKSVANYPKFVARTDCTGNTCTWAEERQNYANWYLYHRRRVDLARTGIGLAFKPLGGTFRLGWGAINTIETNTTLDAGVSLFTQARKDAFYAWLYGVNTDPGGDTPNRLAMDRVGQYFSRSDSDGPWGTNPSYSSRSTSSATTGGTENKANHASCRRSNMLLMTDGYWNGASSNLGNVDNSNGPTIPSPTGSTYRYTPTAPYKDSTDNTLADVAMKYWVNDLLPDLANSVAAVAGVNESFWQNVSFYGIGLGVYGTLKQTAATLADLTSGDISWPKAEANKATAIDDMWHAAINSRGQFLNAGDADSLTSAMEKMMVTINKLSSSQAGVAVSTANLINGTRKYTPQYTTGAWTGNVTSRNLNYSNGNEVSTAWQVESKDPVTGEPVSTIADPVSRNIVVGNGAISGAKAVSFTYAAMSTAGLTNLMTGTVNASLVDYLRGDDTNEGFTGIYRTREARLGDIVNSTPVLVKKGIDLQYDKLPGTVAGASSYRSFVASQASNAEGVMFVGANDGMLHAFRDGTTASPEDGGEEVFAYVPRAVLPHLSQLADKAYAHRYYVDGPLVQSPGYIGGNWKNVLLGTTGAGAKAVFALDVTDPLNMDASSVLWEVSSSTTGFAELGHVITDVQVGLLPSGDWVAIFNNGFFSASGSARLYVVNLATGALIKEIVAEAGSGNGLGGVRVVRDDKQRIIGAYAGDLKGNLWKFDLSGTSSSSWGVGLSGAALLAVGAGKPITAAPSVITHPKGGYLVSVGTGKFFEAGDISTTGQQTLYGIWDSVAFGSSATSTGVAQTGTTNLVQQTISTKTSVIRTIITTDLTTSTQSVTYFDISRNTVDWAIKRGWYINLPNSGERIVYPTSSLVDRYIAVDSISPSNVSANVCIQAGQGTGWAYIIDGLTGSGPGEAVLDTNGDDRVDSADALFSGITARADGRNTWVKVGGLSDATRTVFAGITGGDGTGTVLSISCRLTGTCAVPGTGSVIKSREWRQLFMR